MNVRNIFVFVDKHVTSLEMGLDFEDREVYTIYNINGVLIGKV